LHSLQLPPQQALLLLLLAIELLHLALLDLIQLLLLILLRGEWQSIARHRLTRHEIVPLLGVDASELVVLQLVVLVLLLLLVVRVGSELLQVVLTRALLHLLL
jgi:hypothetical protein